MFEGDLMSTNNLAESVFSGPHVELPQMLDARERRSYAISDLAAHVGESGCVVSITLAVPGPVKTSPVLRALFQHFYDEAHAVLSNCALSEERLTLDAATGPEAQFAVRKDAFETKRLLVPLEEEGKLGRLVDLDVLSGGTAPKGVSRTELGLPRRKCLICDKPSKECGRARAHSVEQMQQAIVEILAGEGMVDRTMSNGCD